MRRVTRCVTDIPLFATGYRSSPQSHYLSFAPAGRPVPLRSTRGQRDFAFITRIDYEVQNIVDEECDFEVGIVGYVYRILDIEGREILAYHWHPVSVSPIAYPHLHLTSRIRSFDLPSGQTVALADMHIPTGFVALSDVVRLLITEFDIQPRRPDWVEILNASD